MNPARWRRGPALFLALAGCFAAGLAGAVPVQAQTCVLRYYWNADGSASWNSRPVNTVDCGTQLAMTRGNGTTEIATIDTSGNLDYYWNVDGSPNWTSGQIGNGSWTTEPPAITRFSNGTEIAVTAGNEFHYYWNIDGSNTWNLSTVGSALLTVGPAITRSGNATGIVGLSAPNTLTYYWNADGSPNWSAELISTQAAQGLYGFPPDAAVTRFSGGTEIAWAHGINLNYAYNFDGSPTWHVSSVGNTAPDNFGPAITRYNGGTEIVSTAQDGSVWYYWNADGSPTWHSAQITSRVRRPAAQRSARSGASRRRRSPPGRRPRAARTPAGPGHGPAADSGGSPWPSIKVNDVPSTYASD